MAHMHFEDTELNREYSGPSHVIRKSDVAVFGHLCLDEHPMHMDEAFARTTQFGGLIAHGLYGLSIMAGLKGRLALYGHNAIASLGWNNVKFPRPIYPDCTVFIRAWATSMRLCRNPSRGIVTYKAVLFGEREDELVSGDHILMVRTRSPAQTTL